VMNIEDFKVVKASDTNSAKIFLDFQIFLC